MKKILIFEIILFATIQAQTTLQPDWLPLALGNKWQYIRTVAQYPFEDPFNDIYIDSVSEKVVINNLEYFKLNWYTYRYDRELQILYKRLSDSDYVVIDFTKNPGFQYSYDIGIAIIVEGNASLFDSIYYYKGFTYFWIYGNAEYRYARDIGLFYVYDYNDVSGHPAQEYIIKLIDAIIIDTTGVIHRTYNNYPEIVLTPITKISTSVFELNFLVNHIYTENKLNFIDSVIMYSHYSKGDSIVSAVPVLAVNQPINTANYFISTVIDTELLYDGFIYNYQFIARDKHLVPKYDFAPDSGYYTAIWDTTTGIIDEIDTTPTEFNLEQNYPNPFNPTTKIKFSIPRNVRLETQFVSLKIFDVLGNEIATPFNEVVPAGSYEVEFSGEGLTSGIYFYQLKVGSFTASKKLVLLK